jgi:hypothetical protein
MKRPFVLAKFGGSTTKNERSTTLHRSTIEKHVRVLLPYLMASSCRAGRRAVKAAIREAGARDARQPLPGGVGPAP